MDEYLFFQKNKNYLKDNNSILSPKIFPAKAGGLNRDSSMSALRASFQGKAYFLNGQQEQTNFMPSPQLAQGPKIDEKTGLMVYPPEVELNSETMQKCLKELSGKYSDQYTSSGFPPKICSLILNELVTTNKLKCQVLDVGCGQGHLGKYLREDGFLHITGLDCSRNLLASAKQTKCYELLEKTVFGQRGLDESHLGKYDVLISASMINNDGWDKQAFNEMLSYVKMGGFLIFTTKLDLNQENQYQNEIESLSNEQHMKFVTDHTFYRYDKLCGGQGKFSNKLVKVVAYQRTDHNEYLLREGSRLEQEAIETERREKEIADRVAAKEAKLNKNKNDRDERKRRIEAEAKAEEDAILNEQLEAEKSVQQQAENLIKTRERKAQMMKKLKTFIQNATWIKLKAIKQQEEEKLEARRAEAEIKRKQTMLIRKQTMLMKKVPYDSDEELVGSKSPGFRAETKVMNQSLPA